MDVLSNAQIDFKRPLAQSRDPTQCKTHSNRDLGIREMMLRLRSRSDDDGAAELSSLSNLVMSVGDDDDGDEDDGECVR